MEKENEFSEVIEEKKVKTIEERYLELAAEQAETRRLQLEATAKSNQLSLALKLHLKV